MRIISFNQIKLLFNNYKSKTDFTNVKVNISSLLIEKLSLLIFLFLLTPIFQFANGEKTSYQENKLDPNDGYYRKKPNKRCNTIRYWRNKVKILPAPTLKDQQESPALDFAHQKPSYNNPAVQTPNPENPQKNAAILKWEENMVNKGDKFCGWLLNRNSLSAEILADTYYDAAHVYWQIANYTKDPKWKNCTLAALKIYQDEYVIPNNGRVPGYWNFTDGITDLLINNSSSSDVQKLIKAVKLLGNEASFAADQTNLNLSVSAAASREVAYTINSYLNLEKLGGLPKERTKLLIDQALGHLDQWFAKGNAPYVRSFMVGLTARSLIKYWENTKDKRIIPSLIFSLNKLWEINWLANSRAFRYQNALYDGSEEEDLGPAPDLNLLIAPAYAWVAVVTSNQEFMDKADLIFEGGVEGAYLDRPKQFNQNYFWSFDYIQWRKEFYNPELDRELPNKATPKFIID